jgi:hypothetical protein
MTFRNPILGDTVLLRPAIQSPNYHSGSSGWSVNVDGSAEFNNVTIRGGETISSTDLYYSGTPAAGNLVASISATGGTDQFGNVYEPGVITYDNASSTFAQLFEGNLFSGRIADIATTDTSVVGYTVLNGSVPCTEVVAPNNQTYTYRSALALAPGFDSTVANGAAVYFLEGNGGARVHQRISGSIQPTNMAGTLLTTIVVGSGGSAPAYNANWASSTAYGTVPTVESLQFKLLPDGTVHVHGAFKTGASAPATNTVFTLPSGYFRTDRVQLFTWHGRIAPASNETIGTGSVNTSGAVALSSTNTGSTSPLVANSTYWMDFIVDGPDVQ